MTLEDVLAALPPGSPYHPVLTGLMALERQTRLDAEEALGNISRPYWEEPVPVEESIALAILRGALELPFPRPVIGLDTIGERLVFSLIGSASPAIIELAESRYPSCAEGMRLELLRVRRSNGREHGTTPACGQREERARVMKADGCGPSQADGRRGRCSWFRRLRGRCADRSRPRAAGRKPPRAVQWAPSASSG